MSDLIQLGTENARLSRQLTHARGEVERMRDLVLVIAEAIDLPLPATGGWEDYEHEMRTRVLRVRKLAELVRPDSGISVATITTSIRGVAAEPLCYTPAEGFEPKIVVSSDGESAK